MRRDWRVEHMAAAGMELPESGLAKSVDLRKTWWKINDQGETGACVGWALADSVLRWHFVQAERLNKSDLLSPRFIWMAAKESDEFTDRPETFIEKAGTSLKAALDVARKYGCVGDALLPFQSASLFPGESGPFYIQAAQFKILMYIRLFGLQQWKRWLSRNRGPLLIRVKVDRTWHDAPSSGHLEFYDPLPNGDPFSGGARSRNRRVHERW